MDALGIVMRISWTVPFLMGTFASGLVIYLTIFRTPKRYQNNTFFMRAHSTTEFIAGVFGWISMPRVIPASDDIVLSSFGACDLIGPKFCYYCSCIFLQCLAMASAIVPINIIFRLYVLYYKLPKTSSLIILTVTLVIPNIGLLILIISIYAPPKEKEYLIAVHKIDNYTFYTYPVYGFQSIHVIQMLTIQALLPLVGFIPPIQYLLLQHEITNSYLIQSTVLWVNSFFPFMSAFVYLTMVREYKRIIFRRFDRDVKRNSGMTPPRGIIVVPLNY